MKITNFCIALILGIWSFSAHAVPVSVSQTRSISADGQNFSFLFNSLPASNGAGGFFRFFARGDYTDPRFETALITLDGLGGSLRVNENGIVNNSITGLSLSSNNTTPGGGGVDQTLDLIFALSGSLLDTLLADSSITVGVDNSGDVDAQSSYRDFVRVGFDYRAASVPEPSAAYLLALGLLGLFIRRKRNP
ncbi:PEP-CTERM sorting domain-containing protein [Marinobacter apostichopi]|uniref:PEP-CTERM sorting domain-containing protein n=1 Tax=Marinobacter apostichopi TaxID=3035454 RepID=UPI0025725924|nr:PEP-CTERM sorting domain-containing protein [Marinobacter sp. LA51]